MGFKFWKKTGDALSKTRAYFSSGLDALFSRKTKIDAETLDDLEALLIGADLGVTVTRRLIEALSASVDRKEVSDLVALKAKLRETLLEILNTAIVPSANFQAPLVTLFVGVNGVGKTTSIGKMAAQLKSEHKTVLLAAADTFRAGAAKQLSIWGERVGAEVIQHPGTDADPSAVAYDAVSAALARKVDHLLIDTAGRLQTKHNLMEELKKMIRVISKQIPDAPHRKILVLDATTGQNALSQAEHFQKATSLTGIVLSKLDGSGKGGIIVPIVESLSVPVLYVGVGESMEDLIPFDAEAFVSGLLGDEVTGF
ncbi:Signal recognition particle receptor FtsY [hydrothermal vent metagenome]|uniref:Signal recognition particle receptor FtsY n=1 Tax=hydrothermal vent metagenome TaxID=652676 RepID=A0A3B1DCR9_9ZZZZ